MVNSLLKIVQRPRRLSSLLRSIKEQGKARNSLHRRRAKSENKELMKKASIRRMMTPKKLSSDHLNSLSKLITEVKMIVIRGRTPLGLDKETTSSTSLACSIL